MERHRERVVERRLNIPAGSHPCVYKLTAASHAIVAPEELITLRGSGSAESQLPVDSRAGVATLMRSVITCFMLIYLTMPALVQLDVPLPIQQTSQT